MWYPRNESTTAGEVDKIEEIQGNVLTKTQGMQIVHKRFRLKLSSSGVRRDIQQQKEAKKT